jgi:hypothetical protein
MKEGIQESSMTDEAFRRFATCLTYMHVVPEVRTLPCFRGNRRRIFLIYLFRRTKERNTEDLSIFLHSPLVV